MSWLMRLLKKASDGTTITMDSGVTGGLILPKCTNNGIHTILGTSTGIVQQSTATPYFYKVMTLGTGSTVVDWWIGPTSSWLVGACCGPTPAHQGDILISTSTATPKWYIAGYTNSSADWKLVTSA